MSNNNHVTEKIPCMHLFIYKLLKQKSNNGIWISYTCIKELMHRRLYSIPRGLHYVFLKEMEEYQLIKRHGNTREIKYELIGGSCDKLLNKYSLPV